MRKMFRMLGVAGVLSLTAGAVAAQDFSVRIGGDGDRRDRIERRMDRSYDRGDRFERHVIRDEPRTRYVVRSKPRYRTVCRTVTRVTRVGNVSIRRPTQECTRRVVSNNRVVIRH